MNMGLGNLVVHLSANATQFERTLKTAEQRLTRTSKKLQALGRSMSMYVTAPLAAIGALSVKAFGDFDQALTQSTAIMGNVSADMRKTMAKTARSIAKESITSAKELAQSYYYLASAGFTAEQSIAALASVNNFAIAGMFDMSKATDLLTDAQSALGMVSKDTAKNQENMVYLGDVLVKANTLANASVQQFSEALTNKAAASLRLLNKDVEEGVAVLAAFADQSKKGVEAGEMLSIMSRDLQSASIRNKEEWEKLGMSVFDGEGKMHSYANVIAQLEDKFRGMSDEQKKTTAAQLGFQDRSFNAIQMLIGMSDRIKDYETSLRSAAGITEEVASKQMKSFNNQMKILWNRVKNVALTIGGILAPVLIKINYYLKKSMELWEGLRESVKKTIVWVLAAVAAIGPLLIAMGGFAAIASAVVGFLSSMIVVGKAVFIFLTGGALVAAIPFMVLAAKIMLVSAAILGVIWYLVGTDGMVSAWDSAKDAFQRFVQFSIGFIANFRENMGILVAWIGDNWKNVLYDMTQLFLTYVSNNVSNMMTFLKILFQMWLAYGNWMGLLFKKIFTMDFVWAIIDGIAAAKKAIKGWATDFKDTVYDALAHTGKSIWKWGNSAWDSIKSMWSGKKMDMNDFVEELDASMYGGAGKVAEEVAAEVVIAEKRMEDRGLDLLGTWGDIISDGIGEMKGPIEGFKSSIEAAPKFNLEYSLMAEPVEKAMEKAAAPIPSIPSIPTVPLPPTVPEIEVPVLEVELPEIELPEVPGYEKGVEKEREADFSQIALNRFSLSGLTGTGDSQKKQAVEAKGVESRLDELINVTKQKESFALVE